MRDLELKRNAASDRGVALIMVLGMVATLSVIAVSLLDATSRSVRVSALSETRLQTDWYVRGVEALAEQSLSRIVIETQGQITMATPGLNEVLAFPIEGGALSAVISDATNCFNVNSLSRAPTDNADTQEVTTIDSLAAFVAILEALEFDRFEATMIAESIADWVDPDTIARPYGAEDGTYAQQNPPYLTANGTMADVSELLAINGISREAYLRLRPYVCARPTSKDSVININTLPADRAELLIPLFSGQASLSSLRGALEQRPSNGFATLGSFFAMDGIAIVAPEQRYDALMSLSSQYFELRGNVVYLDSEVTYETLYGISSAGETKLLRRQFGLNR